ncbi:MAG: hypothetical protein AAGA96_19415 [Verrucomicrobiota bacterium]
MALSDNQKTASIIAPPIIIGLVLAATQYIDDPTLSIVLCISIASLYAVTFCVPQLRAMVSKIIEEKERAKIEVAKTQNPSCPPFRELALFDLQHDFVHVARDTSVKSLPVVPPFKDLFPKHLPKGSQMPFLEERETEYYQLLVNLYEIFRLVIPEDEKLWVAIRDRRSDDHYHTWLRHGSFRKSRENTTQPMHKDDHNTVRQLKRYYDLQGQCVKITGTRDPDWEAHVNDDLGEDRSVLMGAVMTRSWHQGDHEWFNNCLALVVTVNSHGEKVFNSSHVPLLQSAIDSFSWLTNTAMRSQDQINRDFERNLMTAPTPSPDFNA